MNVYDGDNGDCAICDRGSVISTHCGSGLIFILHWLSRSAAVGARSTDCDGPMPGIRHSGMANGPLDMPGETNLNQHARRGNGTGPFAAFAIILWRPYPGCLLGADGYQMSEPVEGYSGVYQGSGSGRHSMAGG